VWPASLLEAFGAAYAGAEYVEWAGPGALAHRFRVVMASQHGRGVHDTPKTGTRPFIESDFALISDTALVRTSVAAVVAAAEDSRSTPSDDSRSDLLVGRLVHRLLQRFGMTAAVDETVLASTIEALRRREDTDAAADARAIPAVLARFAALRRHADVRAQYESGEVFHEVPFTCSVDGQIIRGAIDCLIRQKDGSIRILEFKTGRRRDEHERQADFYKRAAAAVFPDSMIVINVLYA
jgi:ATP-dependent exoDNAse (exonuclease V) beta subunit